MGTVRAAGGFGVLFGVASGQSDNGGVSFGPSVDCWERAVGGDGLSSFPDAKKSQGQPLISDFMASNELSA